MDKNGNLLSLDLGLSNFKIALVEANKSFIKLKNLGDIIFPYNIFSTDNEEITKNAVSAIQKLIKETNVNIKNINIIIPNSFSFTQLLSMPYLNEKELISAVKYQADRFIPLPIEETNIDLEIVEENKNQKNILTLIVAAPKRIIEKVKEITELSGLIPESIENETTATCRFFTEIKLANLVLDFNYDNSTLYYFDKKNFLIREIYNFKIGYIHFVKEIQINTNLKFNQSEEILKNYLTTAKNSIDIEQIITPLIEELLIEFKKFYTLITGKYNEQINKVFIFNYIVNFMSLKDSLNHRWPNFFEILDFSSKVEKNSLFEANKHRLPFYVSTLGGSL